MSDRQRVTLSGKPYTLSPIFSYAPLIGQLADLLTTNRALRFPDVVEGNPLMQPLVATPFFPIAKIGLGLATGMLAQKLARDGHRNQAKIVSVLGFAAGFLPAVNNFRLIQKRGGW